MAKIFDTKCRGELFLMRGGTVKWQIETGFNLLGKWNLEFLEQYRSPLIFKSCLHPGQKELEANKWKKF